MVRHRPQAKFRSALLVMGIVALTVALVICSSSRESPLNVEARVRLLLAEDRLDEALAAARKARAKARPAAAEALLEWAREHGPNAGFIPEQPARAYLLAVTLDPALAEAYAALGALVLDQPFLEHPADEHTPKYASKALELWRLALRAWPELQGGGDFVRAGAGLARAAGRFAEAADIDPGDLEAQVLAATTTLKAGKKDEALRYARRASQLSPERSDVLCLLAELGQLEPVAAVTVADIPLPCRTVCGIQARGPWVAVPAIEADLPVCYVLSTTEGLVKWRVTGCRDRGICLSPSGRYLAYGLDLEDAQPCQVMVLDTASGRSRPVATTYGPLYGAAFSADEATLAISSHEGLLLVELDGSGRRVLEKAVIQEGTDVFSLAGFPHWLPGGAGLATQALYYEGVGAVSIFDPESGARREVPIRLPGHEGLGIVHWSPDGLRVACAMPEENSWVYVTTLDDDAASATIVTSGQVGSDPAAWSPEGGRLLVRVRLREPELGEPRLWLWDRASGKLSLLPPESPVYHAAWGDEGEIYYARYSAAEGRQHLVVLKLGRE